MLTERQKLEFEIAAHPLMKWLYENMDPHCTVLVEYSSATIMQEQLRVMVDVKEKESLAPGERALADLDLDEIGVPEDLAWKMYSPLILRKLIRQGMSRSDALQFLETKISPESRRVMCAELFESYAFEVEQEFTSCAMCRGTVHKSQVSSAGFCPKCLHGITV